MILPFRSYPLSLALFVVCSPILIGCAGAATEAVDDDPWVGSWYAVSINGSAVPADVTVLGYSERVISRRLDLSRGVSGSWTDSTLSALLCVPASADRTTLCNASGRATLTWGAIGDELIVTSSAPVGYVMPVKTFTMQRDGTLLRSYNGETEVYRCR